MHFLEIIIRLEFLDLIKHVLMWVFWTASKTIRYIGCFRFLIQLIIRMKFYIKSHVRLTLYKILGSLVFFLTSGFIRYYQVFHSVFILFQLMGSLFSTPLRTENNIKTLGKRIRVDVASKYGLETQLKSLFYLFVRLYAILCTVTEPIVF